MTDSSDPQDDDLTVRLRPETASVLAALSERGVDVPGVDRPSGPGGTPRYTVLDKVARGGMGVVLRVRDEDLRRELAMKVLDRAGRGDDVSLHDSRDLGRFLEEAQVTGQLDHPGVPAIHELGLDQQGRLFFTMKLVRGGTFLDVIRDTREGRDGWTTTRALGVVLKVCEAMGYAHHKGVIHRDIKPANIMVGRFGETYVMDWGLARVLDPDHGGPREATNLESLASRSIVHTDRREAAEGDASSSLATLAGDVVGTPAYMAPEQARGELEALGPASDIYAVGALLYHLMSGQAPYVEAGVRVSPHTVLRWVIDGPPKPLRELAPHTPPELLAIIDKAMARDPGLRYVGMLDLADDLQAFIGDRVVRAYQSGAWAEARKWVVRNKPLAAAAGLLLLVTIGALGAITWIQASNRAEAEERNRLLGEANGALENANVELEATNAQLAAQQLALEESNAQLGDSNAALADTNARLEDSNARLADAIQAVERSNDQLGQANAALEQANVDLERERGQAEAARLEAERLRSAADLARGEAERAREDALVNAEQAEANALRAERNAAEAEANARRAAESERRSIEQAYAANMTAAVAALESGGGAAARRHLAACPESLRGWAWRHLSLRADASLAVWPGLDSLVFDVDHSPDGRLVAMGAGTYFGFGGRQRGMRLYDAETGEVLVSLPHERTVVEVEFAPDGKLLAFATPDDLRLYDVERRRELSFRHWLEGMPMGMQFVDDRRVAVLALDQETLTSRIDVWNTQTVRVEFTRTSDPGATALRVSPDGSLMAVGFADFSVELWSLPDGERIWRREGIDGDPSYVSIEAIEGIKDLDFDAAGETLTVASTERVVRLLDVETGTQLANSVVAGGEPERLDVHPDGTWVVMTDSTGSVRFLDAESLVEIERLPGHTGMVWGLSISPDGDRIVSGGADDSLRVWDGRPGVTGMLVSDPSVSDRSSRAGSQNVIFSPDGRLIAWVPRLQVVLVADAETGEVLFRVENAYNVNALAFSPDGSRLLVNSEIHAGLIYDIPSGRKLSNGVDGQWMEWASYDPTTTLLAGSAGNSSDVVGIALASDGSRLSDLRGHADSVSDGQFTPDSQSLVTGSQDGTLRVWDLRTGDPTQVIETGDLPFQITLYDDGTKAAVTSSDPTRGALTLWDLESGERIARHPARSGAFAGCLHPEEPLWVGATFDGRFGLFDLEGGELFSLPGSGRSMIRTAFDPAGERLAGVDDLGNLVLLESEFSPARAELRREAARLSRRSAEADALVDALREEHLLTADVVAALEADPSLDADLRTAALREARGRGDHPPEMVQRLWDRIFPVVDATSGRRAPASDEVRAAHLAVAVTIAADWRNFLDAQEPLALLLILEGRFDEAQELMDQSFAAGYSFDPLGPIAMRGLQALLRVERGDLDLADADLVVARQDDARARTSVGATPDVLTCEGLTAYVAERLAAARE